MSYSLNPIKYSFIGIIDYLLYVEETMNMSFSIPEVYLDNV
jgi:hypothetical protein